jgi:hypothetical protein
METLKQLLKKEEQLLEQINSTIYWTSAMFCIPQMEELKDVRAAIRIIRGHKA